MPLEDEISPFNAFVWKHHFLAATCLVYYEWLITLDKEIERIWAAEWNMFTLLWVNVRYSPLLAMVVLASSVFGHWPTAVCRRFGIVPTLFLLAGMCTAHFVFLLRTYALYGRDRRVLYLLVPVIVAELGAVVWGVVTEKHITSTYEGGCIPASPLRTQGIVMWSLPLLFDASVLVLTLAKSTKYFLDHRDVDIVVLMLRDGLMYFGFIFLCYLTNIILFVIFQGEIHDINAAMSGMITLIVTARLILNLRGVVRSKPPSPSYPHFTLTGMGSVLAAFEGPLGTEDRTRDAKRTRDSAAAQSILQRLQHQGEYESAPLQSPALPSPDEPPAHEEYEMHPIRPPALEPDNPV